ncbi:RagB/SusD family nutrient uptake outer membrane protein [Parapedobacter tibetensis]|uniref:RagB/SusD family nutrient uptake outer membrane protein n=1 Tax=Parapedobacter tibetensis TaxID=2972951 RepID=UPI00214D7E96|nr:RagB/SusD family nutrient uptake outer membrane protein [Parapedobacter tibetensis]
MKRLHYIIILNASVLLSSLQSCNRELNALPENALVDANAVRDEVTARAALNGAYYRFANVAGSNTTTWSVNERLPGQLAGYLIYGYGTGASSPEGNNMLGSYTTYWSYAYQIINTANAVIQGVEQLAGGQIEQHARVSITGEARFLRAYGHFKLLSYYGQWFDHASPYGVLIREEPTLLGNIPKARSSVADSYAFILADLDAAAAEAPDELAAYYANKWAAKALKIRVLMCRAQAGDYQEAIRLADEIITTSPYVLEPQVQDLFRSKGLNSSEVILGIQPQPNQVEYPYNRSRQFYPGASALYCATGAFHELLADDPRDWMVGSFREANANYWFTKYIPEEGVPTEVSETSYALRLTEVYLLKAEAILRSGGDPESAKTILRLIGQHAGLTDFSELDSMDDPEDLLLYTYYETVKSLLAEDGQEWLALLRLPFATVQQLRPGIVSDIQYILPVPPDEFRYNLEFGEQNPGYEREF